MPSKKKGKKAKVFLTEPSVTPKRIVVIRGFARGSTVMDGTTSFVFGQLDGEELNVDLTGRRVAIVIEEL